MKKFILLSVAVLAMAWTLIAGEPPVSPTIIPAASDPKAPNAIGPKPSRKELKKEMREHMRGEREMFHAKILEACGPDLKAAGCTGKTGGDMMQCMRMHREAHPDSKMSASCREAHGNQMELKK